MTVKPQNGTAKRGQGILLDFFVSAIFFMVILAAVFAALNNLDAQASNASSVQDINAVAQAAADSLSRTQGLPANWNATNASAIGLLNDEGAVSKTKFFYLMASDYTAAKGLLGAGSYQLFVRMTDSNGSLLNTGLAYRGPVALLITPSSAAEDARAFEMLNNTPLEWDLYWNSPAPVPTANYRASFADANGTLLFQTLLKNAGNYRFVIVYKADVNLTQMDAGNKTRLVQAVNNGSSFIVVGSKANDPGDLITTNFNVSAFKYPPGPVVFNLTAFDDIIQNVSLGDRQTVANAQYYLNWSASLRKFKVIAGNDIPTACSECEYCNICRFSYGSGTVHYLTDYVPWFDRGQISIVGNFTEFGYYPPQYAGQVASVRRVAAIESNGKRDIIAIDTIVHDAAN